MMITFNDNEKKLKDDLNRDIALPAVVHERINTAYRMIEEHTVKQKKKTRNPYHSMKQGQRLPEVWQPLWQLDLFSAQPTRLWQESFRSSEEFLEQLQDKSRAFSGNFFG